MEKDKKDVAKKIIEMLSIRRLVGCLE